MNSANTGVNIAISFHNVTKRFVEKEAVSSVTLQIARGQVFGLIGPNGAGKTTIFSMMAGFLKPSSGIVEVLGFRAGDTAALSSRIGVLPQDALLPSGETVGDFLTNMAALQGFGRNAKTVARDALNDVGGGDWWTMRCSGLSHGMAKRVAIAQAFLGEPELVLLDEPTAGLDPRVAFEVRQQILKRKGRSTIVVSSHNLHELEEICDAAAILDHGKIVACNAIAELTASNEELHIQLSEGAIPLEAIRAISLVTHAAFDSERGDLSVYFKAGDVDSVMFEVLTALLREKARVRGVSVGRGLEKRVMELT